MQTRQWRVISNTFKACEHELDIRMSPKVYSTFELAADAAEARGERYPNGYTDVYEEEIDHEHYK